MSYKLKRGYGGRFEGKPEGLPVGIEKCSGCGIRIDMGQKIDDLAFCGSCYTRRRKNTPPEGLVIGKEG